MTTKPKAKKFRIRRSAPLGGDRTKTETAPQPSAPPKIDEAPMHVDDGFGDQAFTTSTTPTAQVQADAPSERSVDQEIADIRREGLTGRQLRMARRVAQKHGLAPTSDFDAVRLLRARGVDPFQNSQMLELVVNGGDGAQAAGQPQPQLPQTVPQPSTRLPSTELSGFDQQAREIGEIQRDIARRRRRKSALLVIRMLFFVFLPTFLAGFYYSKIATPMYATNSQFLIQQAESASAGGLGSMFAGTGLAVQQDSIAVQSYLESRDAMKRLDVDLGFRQHFGNDGIDAIQRLGEDASLESAYKIYKRNVKIGYDPTEGIIRMEVIAADPDTSEAFSKALISYAEERVDGLTQRLREDQMSGARSSFDDAEEKVDAAQKRVLDLQERLGVLDPGTETSALMGQISNFSVQLQEKKLQLDQLMDNSRPNAARVDGVRGDIKRLETLIANLRSSMTESTLGKDSLARVAAELRIAEADLANRQLLLQQALQQLETARIEANRQVRYLSLGVTPVAPDEPSYPRVFENTLLALLIFGGIYLMVSMTASILREQVSA